MQTRVQWPLFLVGFYLSIFFGGNYILCWDLPKMVHPKLVIDFFLTKLFAFLGGIVMAWGTTILANSHGEPSLKSPLCGTLKCTHHLLRQDFLGVVLSLADESCNRKARGARGARGPVGLGKGSSQAMTGNDSRNLLSCEMWQGHWLPDSVVLAVCSDNFILSLANRPITKS